MIPGSEFGKAILAFFLTVGLACGSNALDQPAPPGPFPPKDNKTSRVFIRIRYRIYAGVENRIALYRQMADYLKSIGFERIPGREDEEQEAQDQFQTQINGTIDRAQAEKVLLEPHVKSILLMPEDMSAQPPEPEKLVRVNLALATGLGASRQRLLSDQVLAKLKLLGFQELIGYDNYHHTRLSGLIPFGRLGSLLRDLRWEPAGWLVSDVPPGKVPAPLINVSPIRVTEVHPETVSENAPPAPTSSPAPGQEFLWKISADLRALASQEGLAKPERIEVILNYWPTTDDRSWRGDLSHAAPGLVIEGRLGPLVTVLASPKAVAGIARLDSVSTVRKPRPAKLQLRPLFSKEVGNSEALKATGLSQMMLLGHKGKGIRVAVVDGDYRGYQEYLGKQLPAATHYLDLTAERNTDLEPDNFLSEQNAVGHGTQAALAAALAAPEADLTLIRIDPATPYMLQAVARYINGGPIQSESLDKRANELVADRLNLNDRRQQLMEERQSILDRHLDLQGMDLLLNKPEAELTPDDLDRLADIKRYKNYLKAEEDYERDEQAYSRRQSLYLRLVSDLRGLKGITLVSNSLVWNDGYPLGGDNGLSKYFDQQSFGAAIWFQAAGNTRGQTWAGLYRDADQNGVMEFAPPGTPLLPNRWTSELNFLAWQPNGKEQIPDLPGQTKLHLSIQWREAHSPEFYPPGQDLYRRPLANLGLVVLHQRDPSGAKFSRDDLDVVARSEGPPQRLDNEPLSATYEQTLDFIVPATGHYAVRIEGPGATLEDRLDPHFRMVADGMVKGVRPLDVATLPALEQSWELWPRLFVDNYDTKSQLVGRPVFLDFVTNLGTLGMPAGSRGLVTVGAANASGGLESYSSEGPPLHLELLSKPDILMYDGLQFVPENGLSAYGSDLASAFAAGTAATALSSGVARPDLLRLLQAHPDKVLRLR